MNFGFVIVAACALTDWYTVARTNKRLEYIFKPATMLALIAATLLIPIAARDAWQTRWFLIGFIFSLAGDVALMLPSPRLFVLGLAAFLFAHISYIVGLNPTLPPLESAWLLLPIAAVAGFIVWRIGSSLIASNHSALVAPVLGYGIAMTLMVFSAYATFYRTDWNALRRVYVIMGATLFFISDALLSWNRFVKPFPRATLAVIVTYHLAQILLALSVQL